MRKDISGSGGQRMISSFDIVKYTLIGMAVAIGLLVLLNRVFGIVTVSGSSMNPTYYDGDILRGEIVTDSTGIERGDIVTFSYKGTVLIKRVEGLPGETLSFDSGHLYIDGKLLDTAFPPMKDAGILADGKTITLGKDEYFCLGDNRNNSMDSRIFGPVKRSKIRSKIVQSLFLRPR